ncbi:bifunctional phosphopantothenoylcysteine decarboxylase/phosphopantothenate synthase, partial [Enterobacter hormaechei subsp. steigerwaltii]|nr:bifunctional phosphopantothenoylcysteine decarboxylase/phosphopantothenate synthase [Enterobacter hormaechei subsp. steigerwaltii]
MGRMPEPAELLDLLPDLWTPKILRGKKILITAGATFEAIDPVRGITNISSGKMGVALARACRSAGAEVSLIHGQLQTALPFGISDTV